MYLLVTDMKVILVNRKFRKHFPKACAPLGTTELLAFLNNTKKDVQKHDTLTKIRFSFKRPRNAERRRIS